MSLTTGGAQGCRVMAEVEQWQALWEAQVGTSLHRTINYNFAHRNFS